MVSATLLCAGPADVDSKNYLKVSFMWVWGISISCMIFAILVDIMPFGAAFSCLIFPFLLPPSPTPLWGPGKLYPCQEKDFVLKYYLLNKLQMRLVPTLYPLKNSG